jgi:tRNA (guanine37-N1)-methyltransferase
MLCAKVPLRQAEKIRKYLAEKGLLEEGYKPSRTKTSVCFPITSRGGIAGKFRNIAFGDADFEKAPSKAQKQARNTIGSYDIVGDIAIVEIPKNLQKGRKRIAKSILSMHKNISTVLMKKGGHEGTYRLQKLELIGGAAKRETLHREHGCLLRLDVEKVYFSPRLSTERKRIASQVKKGESVLVMFSGCGVYPIIISKNSRAGEIYGVEINPTAHRYALGNAGLNRAGNVVLLKGDARKVVSKLKKRFDRIVMPLPKDAGDFLETAFLAAKKGSIIHLYGFFEERRKGDLPSDVLAGIGRECKKAGLRYRILRWVKCGQTGPRSYRVCVDFKILG